MSLENRKSGAEPSPFRAGEGRRAQGGQSPASAPNSGGVSVDGTLGRPASEGWEVCGGGQTQPPAQVGTTGQAGWAAAEVGGLYRSVDLWALDADYRAELRRAARRGATCHQASKRREGHGDGPQGIGTPAPIRQLQITLYRKASRVLRFVGATGGGKLHPGCGLAESDAMKALGEPRHGKPVCPVR
jgi:hypothetical protein